MNGRTVLGMGVAFFLGMGALRAGEPPAGDNPPTSPSANPPSSWQERLADLLKRDSELNGKIDQLDQAIREKHDELARSLAKELRNERSAFHQDLKQMKEALQAGIRGAAKSLGKGAGQIKEEAAKLQEALDRAAQQKETAPAPAQPE
ncbi:hypothetical protein [Methylacidimicrobium cyclopophantes]|nr:hypothetical protein [Methylacidimicrobium cyclopophantes]